MANFDDQPDCGAGSRSYPMGPQPMGSQPMGAQPMGPGAYQMNQPNQPQNYYVF